MKALICGITGQDGSYLTDFVVATGVNRSVSDFLDLAASFADVNWRACVEKGSPLFPAD
jgi:GDP-D-mannose dehydratase